MNLSDVSNLQAVYVSTGNFPSISANALQVAKMVHAYQNYLPSIRILSVSHPFNVLFNRKADLRSLYGLASDIDLFRFPIELRHLGLQMPQHYRAEPLFRSLVLKYCNFSNIDLAFTRSVGMASQLVAAGVDTVLESHLPWESDGDAPQAENLFDSEHLKLVVTVTRPLKASFVRAGFPEQKIVVLPDGVDLEQYQDRGTKRQIRSSLGLPIDKRICVYTGHLYEDRGFELLLQAAEALPLVLFVLVGGWEADILRIREAVNLRKLENVSVVGHKEQSLVPLYQLAADVLVLQYSAKTAHADRASPLKMFEYLAAGGPILAPDLPVFHEILTHYEDCLLYEPDSLSSFLSWFELLQEEADLAFNLQHKARSLSQQFAWSRRAEKILQQI